MSQPTGGGGSDHRKKKNLRDNNVRKIIGTGAVGGPKSQRIDGCGRNPQYLTSMVAIAVGCSVARQRGATGWREAP